MGTVVLLDHVLCVLQLGDDPARLPGEEQNVAIWIGIFLCWHGVRLKIEEVFRCGHDRCRQRDHS